MKNLALTAIIAASIVASCSTVSSIVQNTLPFSTNIVVTQGSPANTTLSAVGAGTSISQIAGSVNNVKDIRLSTATMAVTSGSQGMGVFKNVKVYLTSGNNEILVASRENIGDNIGSSLSLDANTSQVLDNILKSGNSVQQRIVYELKTAPASDLSIKTSMNFSSVPVTQ